MAAITRPRHTGLQVRDLERSVSIYRDVLGFEVVFAWNPEAPYIGELVGYPDVDLHAAILRRPIPRSSLSCSSTGPSSGCLSTLGRRIPGPPTPPISSMTSTPCMPSWSRKAWSPSLHR